MSQDLQDHANIRGSRNIVKILAITMSAGFYLTSQADAATLFPGKSLHPGESIQSDNKLHTLTMQNDGNVVLYDRYNHALWATNTFGSFAPRELRMQTDGNLVLYSTDGKARWASGTFNHPEAFLNIQDDGNLVIYHAGSLTETADNALWAAGNAARYEIFVDYTDAPELKDWVTTKLQPTLDHWYPKIIAALPSNDFAARKTVFIRFTNQYKGVAATRGNRIDCDANYFKARANGETGVLIHELVHVIQSYPPHNPTWLTEGIADYIRWFKYEAEPTGARPQDPARAKYTDSYRTTAGFLNFVATKHDKDIVKQLNADMRQAKYSPESWKKYTGKTADELWKDYVSTL